jgi:hypothetical protein
VQDQLQAVGQGVFLEDDLGGGRSGLRRLRQSQQWQSQQPGAHEDSGLHERQYTQRGFAASQKAKGKSQQAKMTVSRATFYESRVAE